MRAAAAYFSDAKYTEAQTQFERFVRDYRESPLLGQAMFGVAACLDAQGKTSIPTPYGTIVKMKGRERFVKPEGFALDE
mgnify:CR=1 FL=1